MQLFKSANLPVQSLKQGRKICHGSLTHPQDMSEYQLFVFSFDDLVCENLEDEDQRSKTYELELEKCSSIRSRSRHVLRKYIEYPKTFHCICYFNSEGSE
jgi:hypothetical protein